MVINVSGHLGVEPKTWCNWCSDLKHAMTCACLCEEVCDKPWCPLHETEDNFVL